MTQITEETTAAAQRIERAATLMELEGFKPFDPKPLNLPEQVSQEDVARLIGAPIDNGTDPADDPAVLKALAQREIANHTYSIRIQHEQAEAQRRLGNAREQAPALIQEMKDKFDAAADVLRASHKILGDEPLWDDTAYFAPHDKTTPSKCLIGTHFA